jgi:ketosteroid isomerase-like protein
MSDTDDIATRYEAYLAAFNAKDLTGLARHLAPDVVFEWNGEMPDMHGRDVVLDFYREAWTHLDEKIRAREVEVAGDRLLATITNELRVFREWPECPLGPMTVGPPLTISGSMEYLYVNGRIAHIAER